MMPSFKEPYYTMSLCCAVSVVFPGMFGNASCTCQIALLFQVYAKENTASFPGVCFSKEPHKRLLVGQPGERSVELILRRDSSHWLHVP